MKSKRTDACAALVLVWGEPSACWCSMTLRQDSCSWFKCRQGKKSTLVTIEEVWGSHPADSNDPGEVSELHGGFLKLSCLKPMRPDYSRTQFGGSQTNCGGIVSLA